MRLALKNIDDIIAILKNSRSADDDAKEALMDKYKLSEPQSNAILEMKIRRLAMLEQEKIRKSLKIISRLENGKTIYIF